MAMGKRASRAGVVVSLRPVNWRSRPGPPVFTRDSTPCWPRPGSTGGWNSGGRGVLRNTTRLRAAGGGSTGYARVFPPACTFRMGVRRLLRKALDSQACIAWRVCRQLGVAAVSWGLPLDEGTAGSLDADQHPQASAAGSVHGGCFQFVLLRLPPRRSCCRARRAGAWIARRWRANAAMKSIGAQGHRRGLERSTWPRLIA